MKNILRPDVITKIIINRVDVLPKRTFPGGWDPFDGYPSR